MSTNVPAGWYPDQTNPGTKRWWDGTAWTHHTQPPPPVVPPPPPAPQWEAPEPPGPLQRPLQTAAQPTWPAPAATPPIAPDGPTQQLPIVASPANPQATDPSLQSEREKWLAFAKREFWEMVEAFDAERADLERQIAELEQQLVERHDRVELQAMGFFDGDHPTADSIDFKEGVETAKARRKEMGRRKDAVLAATGWTVNGSATEGRKMIDEFSKLMLRAYNSELDALIGSVNATNAGVKTQALGKKRDQIKRLGRSMNIEINPAYHDLAVYEIRQTGNYQAAKLREKEAERAHREELREQAKAEDEIKREQEKLDREATMYRQALAALEANPEASADELASLREKLVGVEEAQADVMLRAANARAGHVYVISNPGAFGDDMVKIGMTRRLNPMDRVNELGDASVPFRFSVHALIFADDAVALEAELHRRFEAVRVNRVNQRREFFRATPQQVRDVLIDLDAHLLEFSDSPINEEWDASR